MTRQIPTRSPYSRSVTAAMFFLNTAFAGGARWLDRCSDSRVAKFSGQTSHGTMNVRQIFACPGHSIGFGRPIVVLLLGNRRILALAAARLSAVPARRLAVFGTRRSSCHPHGRLAACKVGLVGA